MATAETLGVATDDAGVLAFQRIFVTGLPHCDFCDCAISGFGWNHSDGAHGDTLICDPCGQEAKIS